MQPFAQPSHNPPIGLWGYRAALLAAAARKGLASPSPEDTAAWNKIMRDEIKIAKELPVVSESDAATAEAPVIERDYFVFLLGSAAR